MKEIACSLFVSKASARNHFVKLSELTNAMFPKNTIISKRTALFKIAKHSKFATFTETAIRSDITIVF